MEGLIGTTMRVIGLYRFELRLEDGQDLMVDCLVVDGCGDEFLIGSDFARAGQLTLDHHSVVNKMKMTSISVFD